MRANCQGLLDTSLRAERSRAVDTAKASAPINPELEQAQP